METLEIQANSRSTGLADNSRIPASSMTAASDASRAATATEGCDPQMFPQAPVFLSVNPPSLFANTSVREWHLHRFSSFDIRHNDQRADQKRNENIYLRSHRFDLPFLKFQSAGSGKVNLEMVSSVIPSFFLQIQFDAKKGTWGLVDAGVRSFGNPDASICGSNEDCLEEFFLQIEVWKDFFSDLSTGGISFTFYTDIRGYRNMVVERKESVDGGLIRRRVFHFIDRKDVRKVCASRIGVDPADRPSASTMRSWCDCGSHVANLEKLSCDRFSTHTSLRCESWDYRDDTCENKNIIESIIGVSQESRSACRLNSSYGFSGSEMWVKSGCRGVFRIKQAGGSGSCSEAAAANGAYEAVSCFRMSGRPGHSLNCEIPQKFSQIQVYAHKCKKKEVRSRAGEICTEWEDKRWHTIQKPYVHWANVYRIAGGSITEQCLSAAKQSSCRQTPQTFDSMKVRVK